MLNDDYTLSVCPVRQDGRVEIITGVPLKRYSVCVLWAQFSLPGMSNTAGRFLGALQARFK